MGRFGSLSNWNLQPSAESQASLKSQAGQAAQDQYNALLDQSAAQLAGPAPSAFLPAPITTSLNPQWSPPPEAQFSMPPVPARPAPQGWLDSASRSFQAGLAGTGGMLAGAAGLIGNTDAQAGIQKWTSDTIQGLAPEQYARPEASMGQKILDPDWWKTTAAQALGSGGGSMGVSLLASAPLIVATAFAPEIAGAVGISVGVARVIGILSTTLGRAGIDSVMESASAYQDARQSGKSESEASQIASTVGANNMLLNVGLEAIPGFGQLANVGKAITKGAVRGGVIKALEQEWGDVAMASARQRLGAELTQQGWMTGARNYAGAAARGAVEEYLQERQQGEIQQAASDGRPWDLARALTSHELDDDGLAGALISLAGGAIGGAGSRAVRAGRSLMSPSPQLGIQGGGAIGGPPVPEQPRTLQEVLADVESNDAAARAMRRGNNAGPSAMANLDARSADLYAELVALAPPGAVKTVEDYLTAWTGLDGVGEISEAQIVRDLEQGSPIPDKELFGKIVSAILMSGPQFVGNQQNEWMYVDPQAGTPQAGTPQAGTPQAGEGEDKFQTNPVLTRTINRLLGNSPAVRPLFEGGRLVASNIEPIITVLNQQLPIGQKVTAQELADYVNQNILGRDQDVFDPSVEYDQSPGNAVQPRGTPEELRLRGETYDDRPLVPGTAEYAAYVQRQNERRGIRDGSSTVQDTGDQGGLGQDEDLEQPDDVESDLSVFDFDRLGSFSVARKAGLLEADFQGVSQTGTPWPGSGRLAGFSLSDVNKLIAIKRPAPMMPATTTRAPAQEDPAAVADREYKKSLGDALFDPDIRNEVKNRKPGPTMSNDLASHLQVLKLQYPTKTIGTLLSDMRAEAYRIEEPVRPVPVVAPQTTTRATLAPARVVAPPSAAQGPVRSPAGTASFPFDKSNDGSYQRLVNEAGVQGDIKTGDGFINFDRSLEEILLDKARPLNERSSAVTNLHSMYEALVKEEQKYYPDLEEAASRVRYRLAAIVAPDEMAEMEDIIEDVSPEGGDKRRTIPFVLVGVSGASEDALFRDRRNLEGLAQAVRKANDDGSIGDGSATDVLRGVQYLHSVRVSNNDTGRKTISGIVVVDTASTKGQSDAEILEQLKMAAKIGLQLQPRSEDAPVVIGRSVQRDPVVGDVVELLASHAGNNPGTTGMVISIGSGTFNSAMAIVRIDGVSSDRTTGAHGNTRESSIPLSKLGVYEVHDDDEVAVSGSSATEPTMDRYTVSGRRRWTIANAFKHVRDWTSGATMRPVSTRRLLRHIWGQNAKDYQTEQEIRSELVRGIEDQNAKDYRTREEVARELGRVRDVAETDEQFEARVQEAMASERRLPSARQNADAQFEARVKEEMEYQRSMPSARQEALTGLAAEMASLALDPYRNAYLGTDDPATKVRKIRDLNDRFGDIDINEDPDTGAGRYNLYLLTLKELNDAATGYGDKWSEARANGTPAPEGRRERSVDEESIEPFTVSEKDREFFRAELNRILEMRRGQRNAEARSGSESSGVDEQAAWIASLRESERTKPIRSELTREEIALQNPELDAAGIDALMQEYQLVPFMSYRAGSIDQIILSLARPQPKETVEAILSTISDAADMYRNARSGNEKITDTFAYYLGGLLGGRKGFKGGVRARGDAQTILDIFTANRGEGFRNAVMRFAGEQALNPTQNFYLFRTRFSIALADAGFWKWRPDGTLYDRIAPDGGKFQKDQRVFDPSTNSRGRVLEDQGLLVRMTIAGGRRRHVQNVSVRWSSGELHGQTTNIHPLDITLLGENGMPQKSLFTLNNPMPMDMRMGTKISVPDAERLWGRIAGWDTRLFGDSATARTKLVTIFQDLVSRNIPDKDAVPDLADNPLGLPGTEERNEARKKAAIFLAQMVSIHGSPAGTSSTTISDENMTTVVGVLNGIDRTGATARAFNEERMRWARQTPRTMNDIVRQGLRSRPDTITEMVGVDDDIDDDATVIADAGDEYDGKKVPRGMQIIERPMTASDRRISAGARRLVTAAWRGIQSDPTAISAADAARKEALDSLGKTEEDVAKDPELAERVAQLVDLELKNRVSGPVSMNIGMRDDQDRHITNKSTAVRDPLTRSRMSAIADVLGRSGLLGDPMRQADVRREGAIASNQARASQVTEDMIRDETSRDTFFMQYYRDNLMGGQNDGVTAAENMARLFATWSDANADLASGRQFIDGDLIARYLHAVSPEPKENSRLKPVAGIVNRVLALMNQSNRALLQEANRDSDQARKDALLAVHAIAKAEVVRFQEAHARLIGAPETAEEKAATVQEALPVLVANQMAANRVVGPLDRAMVQATQVPDAVETDPTVTEVTGVTGDGVAPVEPDPKETAAKIEAYLRANPGRTKGQIARGTRLTVLQVEEFLTTPGTSAVASGKSGGHATYSIGTAEETVQEETVQEETVQEETVQEETAPVEPVVEGEATVQDPMWETAKLFMKTTARTIGQISNKLGGNDLAGTRALIDAHIDEIQVIAGARIGVQDRYRMLDAGEAKVEPVRPVAPGRRGTATATATETEAEPVEEGSAVAEGTEGQAPEVQLEEVTEDGEDEYDGPWVDIVGETSHPDGFGTRRTRSRQPRATTPQWTSIQSISAGIDSTEAPKQVVVLLINGAGEARGILADGLDPQVFGPAFEKGLQSAETKAADIKEMLRKRTTKMSQKDKQDVFVIIARAEDQDHITSDNIIGVTPLGTFSPSVVSLEEEEVVTPEVTGPTRDEVRKLVEAETLAEWDMQSPDELGEAGERGRDAFDTYVDAATDERMKPPAPVRGTGRTVPGPEREVTGGAVGLRQFEPPTVPGIRPGSIGGVVGEKPTKGGALVNAMDPTQRLAARDTADAARKEVLDSLGKTEEDVAKDPELAERVAQLVEINLKKRVSDIAEREREEASQQAVEEQGVSEAEMAKTARRRFLPGQQVNRTLVGRAFGLMGVGNADELDRTFKSLVDMGLLVPSTLTETRDGMLTVPAPYVMDPSLSEGNVVVTAVPGSPGAQETYGRFGPMTLEEVTDNGAKAILRTTGGKRITVVLSRLQFEVTGNDTQEASGDSMPAVEWNNMPGMETWSAKERERFIKEAQGPDLGNPLPMTTVRNDMVAGPLRTRLLGGQPVDEKIMANALNLDQDWRTEQLFQQMVNQGLFIREPLQDGPRISLSSTPKYIVAFDAQDLSGPVLVRYTGNGLNQVMAFKGIDEQGRGEFDSTTGGKQQRYVIDLNGKDIALVDRSGKALDPDALGPWRPKGDQGPGDQGPGDQGQEEQGQGDQGPGDQGTYQTAEEFMQEYITQYKGFSSSVKESIEFYTLPSILILIQNPSDESFGDLKPGTKEFDAERKARSERFLEVIRGMHATGLLPADEARAWLDKANGAGANFSKDVSLDWPPPPAPPTGGGGGGDGGKKPPGNGTGGGNDIVLPEVAVTRKRWYDGILRAFGTSNSLRFTNMLSNPMSTMNEFITQIGNVASLKAQARMAAELEDRAGLSPSERKMTKEMSRGTTTLSDGTVIGWGSGIMDGMQMAMQVMRTGDMPEALIVEEKTGGRNRFVNQELLRDAWGREFGETGRKIGNVIGMPMRIRMANDILFATVGESIGIHMMANREAVRDGLEPDTKEYGNRVVQYADAIRDELYLGRKEAPARDSRRVPGVDAARIKRITGEASNIARNLVWQGEMKSMSFGLEQARWASPIMNFIIPFMQVGARIARAGADMTPGLGQALMGWDIARGDYGDPKAITSLKSLLASDPGMREDGTRDNSVRPASMRLAAQGMGLMVSGLGATLAMAGLLTGAGPDDDRERAAWLADGKRPYSLKIGGTYVNAALVLGPLAWPLIAGALIYDGATGKNKAVSPTSETWQNLAGATNEWIFNQTALSNLSRVIDATQNKGSGKNFERWIASSVVAPFVPYSSALRAISSASDDVKRDPQTFIDFMKMYFPGASQGVKAKTDDLFKAQGRTAAERYLPFVSSVEQASDRPYAVIGAKSQQEATRIRQAQTLVADYFRNPLTAPKPTDEDFTMVLRYGRNPSRYYDMQRKIGKLVAERTAVA